MKIHRSFLFALVAALTFPIQGQVPAQPGIVSDPKAWIFRVAGSTISDPSGVNLGNIEALAIDPQSGQLKFAMVSLGYPANRTTLTPIPWQFIQHRSDARQAGGIPGTFQQFTVPVSPEMLRRAPQLDSQTMARISDASWMTTSYAYFAPLATAGGVSATSGTQTGTGNSSANPNVAAFSPSPANGFVPTNSFAPNAPFEFTNQPVPRRATNAFLPAQPALPPGALPPGTLPAGGVPPGTLPAGALPPGIVPNEPVAPAPNLPPDAVPPAIPGTPGKVLLTPASPAAPTKR